MKSSSLMSLAGTALFVLFSSGCASLPEPRATPNGQPLEIREHTEQRQYTVKQKVGEVEHKDSHGKSIGKSTVYANRTQTARYQVWNAYQGDTQILDDDLYRIAKDEAADREVRESRESGVLMNRIGLGVLAVGILAAGSGIALRSQLKEGESTTLPQVLLYAGIGSASLGAFLTWTGLSKANSEHPLDQDRAARAADVYNSGLSSGRSASAAGGRP